MIKSRALPGEFHILQTLHARTAGTPIVSTPTVGYRLRRQRLIENDANVTHKCVYMWHCRSPHLLQMGAPQTTREPPHPRYPTTPRLQLHDVPLNCVRTRAAYSPCLGKVPYRSIDHYIQLQLCVLLIGWDRLSVKLLFSGMNGWERPSGTGQCTTAISKCEIVVF